MKDINKLVQKNPEKSAIAVGVLVAIMVFMSFFFDEKFTLSSLKTLVDLMILSLLCGFLMGGMSLLVLDQNKDIARHMKKSKKS